MVSKSLVEAVFERWGTACVVCGRRPEEWLETDFGTRTQANLSFHHVNGDDTDDRVENLIPLCQSCHVHTHRVDEPPYRLWHRQLPLEHRHAWNQHYHEYYEGPRLTREEATQQFGDDDGIPESTKYLEYERDDWPTDNQETTAGRETEDDHEDRD
ncbi:HNH endonuclease [Halobacterium salinarum]|uniref:HNH endonuclease n=1 Tax=Halobacterium salinarum TaxID=2242 RepID=UPI002553348C|nr:HNH endonuclease [Halobacterium salinarum]MDL0130133.1 HNH endonuclease [Halobacterium salinarum]